MTERKKFEHISTRPVPYTTKTGIQIGIAYEPPPQRMTADGEFMQGVLLGVQRPILPGFSRLGSVLYMISMVALLTTIVLVMIK